MLAECTRHCSGVVYALVLFTPLFYKRNVPTQHITGHKIKKIKQLKKNGK